MEPQHEDEALKAEAVAVAAAPQMNAEEDKSGTEELRTLRIAFVGNVDSGKSSLIGKLLAMSIESSSFVRLTQTARNGQAR